VNDLFDPRYLLNHPYSKADFIFLTEVLIQANQDDAFALDILQKNLAWANQHDENVLFSWEFDTQGTLRPVATASASIPITTKPKLDPPSPSE